MQKKYQAFLISVIAYGGMFFLRDCITSSSAHLSKLGYFTGEHYSIYVACNYAAQGFSRLFSGLLIDWSRMPKTIYLVTCAIAILAIFLNTFLRPYEFSTVILFGLVYVIVKTMASFSRNSIMKILAIHFQNKNFGTVNNLLSGCGAICNATCMVMITQLYHKSWTWQSIWYLIAGLATVMNIPAFFLQTLTVNNTNDQYLSRPVTIKTIDHSLETMEMKNMKLEHSKTENTYRKGLRLLFTDARFYLIALVSCSISIVRLSMSFMAWYLVVMLGKNSADVPAIAAILFGIQIVSVFAGAALNQLPRKLHNTITFATSILTLVSFIALYYIHKGKIHSSLRVSRDLRLNNFINKHLAHLLSNDPPSFIVCMAVMASISFFTTPINCLCDGLYAYEISTQNTQSTSMGAMSSFGYIAASIGAYLIKKMITNKDGWMTIIKIQLIASAAVVVVTGLYILKRR